jgi:pilus assembly protein CpaB
LLAAVLAFTSLRAFGGSDGAGNAAAADVQVVVATARIEAGTVIEAGMLKVAPVSESSLVEGALTSQDDLVGLIARYPVEKGAQLTASTVGQQGDANGSLLGRVIPAGKRAMTVEVSEERVFGGLLAPGDHVDVIAIYQRTEGEEEFQEAIALVQNVEVLSVADESLIPVTREDKDGNPIVTDESAGVLGTSPDDPEAQPEARSVTLAVDPADALRVALAQEEGSLWLSLRGSGDNETLPIAPQTLN